MNENNPTPSSRISRRMLLGAGSIGAAGLAGALATRSARQQPHPATLPLARRRFEGKVVAITGATSGIGRAAAIQFAAEGGQVAFCGRREQLGNQVAQLIRDRGGEATYIRADVRNEADVRSFIDRTVAIYSRLDVGFNNAGITLEKPLHEFTAAEWDDIQNTNLRGVFLAMKYEIPYMLAGGGGNIVITSSSNALGTTEKRSAYSASKRGLVGLAQAATFDYAQHGIRVNVLVPGTTDTALIRRVAGMEQMPDALWELGLARWAKSNVPGVRRVAQPEEIAAFALVLASDEHPFLTGAQLVIDGGKTAHGG